MRIIGSDVLELVICVGASHDSADVDVGIGFGLGEPIRKTLPAADLPWKNSDRWNRGAAVVHLRRILCPVTHHVGDSPWILPQDVVHLLMIIMMEMKRMMMG